MPGTLIVIPHYGSDQLIHDLFKSVGSLLPENSFNAPLTLLQQPEYSFLIVNNNVTRAGFTEGCNKGLALLTDQAGGYDYAWLLNNDTLFEGRDQFERSLRVMQSLAVARDWAIVAQQVRYFEQPDHIVFGGAWECFPAGRHKSGMYSRGDWASPSEEGWLSFCSVLVRADLVRRIGPMDEAFTNYFSDSDYSLAARRAGFRIGYAGRESYVLHRVGQSANPGDNQKRVMHADYMAFWKKWISGPGHADYLRLMSHRTTRFGNIELSQMYAACDLAAAASAYPELKSWLGTLPERQLLCFRDILDHYQHLQPVTEFSVLCSITRQLLETD